MKWVNLVYTEHSSKFVNIYYRWECTKVETDTEHIDGTFPKTGRRRNEVGIKCKRNEEERTDKKS